MERTLVRQMTAVLTVMMLVVVVPATVFAVGWWRRLGILLLCLVALVVGHVLVRRRARRIAEPIERLTAQAEQMGEHSASFRPLRTEIDEINRISQVFEKRTGEFTRTLAAEREFAADASHQLRTPLTALLMRLEEISMADDLEVAHEEARVGIDQAERLTGVVDDLLQRTRRGASTVDEITSLDSVIAQLQRELQPTFARMRRSLRVIGERDLRVRITRSALGQILSTLVENALIHGSGTVEMNARRSGPSVVVEVSDKGKGVDPDLGARVFDRKVTTGGTGLGLGLARDLAGKNAGRLELRSANPAVFALFLSAVDEAGDAGGSGGAVEGGAAGPIS